MCGYTASEMIGKKAFSLFLADASTDIMKEKNTQREQGYSDAYELCIKDKNGNQKWWLISGAPHYNDVGIKVGTIGIHLDITEQTKLQSDLIFAWKQAEESAKSKQVILDPLHKRTIKKQGAGNCINCKRNEDRS